MAIVIGIVALFLLWFVVLPALAPLILPVGLVSLALYAGYERRRRKRLETKVPKYLR